MKLKFQAHCSDSFGLRVLNEAGQRTRIYHGYVPRFLGGSDDVELEVDIETGRILNWDAEAVKTELETLGESR